MTVGELYLALLNHRFDKEIKMVDSIEGTTSIAEIRVSAVNNNVVLLKG